MNGLNDQDRKKLLRALEMTQEEARDRGDSSNLPEQMLNVFEAYLHTRPKYGPATMQHHYVVFGVEDDDGNITFALADESDALDEKPIFDLADGEWRGVTDEHQPRDERITAELSGRLKGAS